MNIDKTRKQFESYWTARCNELGIECVLTRLINDEYFNHPAHYAWIGWKASRESMVIELPISTYETPSGDNALREDAVFDALESAGIEVVQK